MADLKWFVGIDWGSRIHQACILDANGDVRAEHAFAHGGAGFAALTDWILSGTEEAPADQVGVAIETPRGPVVETLLGCGFAVHSINPRQLDRFRDRYSHAGAKDDRRDALVLASALRTDPHRLLRLELPRFCGHLQTVRRRCSDAENSFTLRAGVPAPDG